MYLVISSIRWLMYFTLIKSRILVMGTGSQQDLRVSDGGDRQNLDFESRYREDFGDVGDRLSAIRAD